MSNRKVYWKFYFLIWGHFNHSRACKSYTVRLPLPSRVSLSRARSFLRILLPSACYAGYLVTKVFQNGTMFVNIIKFVLLAHEILCHPIDGDNVMSWPECVEPTPPLRKNRPLAAQLKLPFGDYCLNKETISVLCASPNGVGLVRTDCRHQLASSNKLPIVDQTPLPSHTSSYLKVRTRSLIFWFSILLCTIAKSTVIQCSAPRR